MTENDKGKLLKSYVGRLKKDDLLNSSSSGGAFTALSDLALNSGNAIVCSIYDYMTSTLFFRFVYNVVDRDKARGSKYMHSDSREIYKEIKDWLISNPEKQIMYFGMGCEAAGLSNYLETLGLRKRCLIIDIICHGSCSPKIWNDYVNQKQKVFGHLSFINFKDKRNGWHKPTAVGLFGTKEVFLDEYMKIYYSNKAMRPSCHSCQFSTKYRYTDITIGDAWRLKGDYGQSNDEKGYSLFLIHTEEGISAFNKCINSIDFFEINEEDCFQPALIHPTPSSKFRNDFWNEYYEKGFSYILKKYGRHTFILGIKEKIKNILFNNMTSKSCINSSKRTYHPLETTQYFGNESEKSVNDLPQLYNKRSDCFGCTACSSICPMMAIFMKEDQEGYFYPSVDIEKCIRCYKCLDVCPLK